MKSWKRMQIVCILVVLLAALAPSTGGATSRQAVTCGGWSIVPSPNPTNYLNILNGVTALSATDAWAVGLDFVSNGSLQTVTEHWNGTSWQVVPSPSVESSNLGAVTAVSANDIWAVGYGSDSTQTLIEHWNGTQWSIIPSPSVGSYLNGLASVSAVSARDIWAVGSYELASGQPYRTLIEHWDGKQWSIVKSPNVGSYGSLLKGVTALSPTDVWAVGGYGSSQRPYVGYPLVEHWDGSMWSRVQVPGPNWSGLSAVTSVNANDLWTVGANGNTSMTEHWDGSRWRIVKSPLPNGSNDRLASVAAVASSDVWTVSNYTDNSFRIQTLTEHWDGTQWRIMPSPNMQDAAGQPALDNYLSGVANVPSTHTFWAVGYYQPHDSYTGNTLIEYYC